MTILKKEGIGLKCPHVKCGHTWYYRGSNKVCVICPDCRGVVKIRECQISK